MYEWTDSFRSKFLRVFVAGGVALIFVGLDPNAPVKVGELEFKPLLAKHVAGAAFWIVVHALFSVWLTRSTRDQRKIRQELVEPIERFIEQHAGVLTDDQRKALKKFKSKRLTPAFRVRVAIAELEELAAQRTAAGINDGFQSQIQSLKRVLGSSVLRTEQYNWAFAGFHYWLPICFGLVVTVGTWKYGIEMAQVVLAAIKLSAAELLGRLLPSIAG